MTQIYLIFRDSIEGPDKFIDAYKTEESAQSAIDGFKLDPYNQGLFFYLKPTDLLD